MTLDKTKFTELCVACVHVAVVLSCYFLEEKQKNKMMMMMMMMTVITAWGGSTGGGRSAASGCGANQYSGACSDAVKR